MPLYDYQCRHCGPFRDWRAMVEYRKPAKCPKCGKLAPRSAASPALGMDWQRKMAHSINEKSGHEPRVVRRRRGDPMVHDARADLSRHREQKLAHEHAHDRSQRGDQHRHLSNHPWMVRH